MIGKTLAHFEITAQLGKGGMGDVWRATDSRLDREVAIKVLPELFTAEPDRLARFEREARVLASLTHPNIAAIHDSGEQDGQHFLVMELATGETLAARIERGPLPADEALAIAGQIANAVSAANDQGVVHRDLKPGNVMVAPDGKVKVLDFGLAKALTTIGASGSTPALSLSPTMTFEATAVGMLLGTAAYMSPEQAKGKPVDRRSDTWSWGCVLFEMLTGKPVFDGDTMAEILAEILRAEPNWEALPKDLAPGVLSVLRHCLAKDPENRLRDVADARLLIERADQTLHPRLDAKPSRAREALAWFLAALALVVAIILGWRGTTRSTPSPLTRLTATLPEGQRLAFLDQPILDFSPDGRTIAFVANDSASGTLLLHVRGLDSTTPLPLPGTEGASAPFFSPDGKWLAFFAGEKLKKILVVGGPVTVLADAEGPRGAVWAEDDTIIFSPRNTSGLWQVSAAGGPAKEILARDEKVGERTLRWPALLADDDWILFTVGSANSPNNYDEATVDVWNRESGERRKLIERANMALFLPPNRLLFYRDNVIHAVALDMPNLSTIGSAMPVVEGVLGDPSSGAAYFSVSNAGSLAFVPGSAGSGASMLALVDRDGETRSLPLEPRAYHHPRFSDDGSRIAFTIGIGQRGAGGDIWTYSLTSETLSRLTFDQAGVYPLWSPGSEDIAFAGIGTALRSKPSDGAGATRTIVQSEEENFYFPGAWSPDGRTIACSVSRRGTSIFLVTEDGSPRLFESDAHSPAFSPDGRWLAYAQPATGPAEIFVRPVEGEGKWQISTGSGESPRWTTESGELFFLRDWEQRRQLVVVEIDESKGLRFGSPRVVVDDTTDFMTITAPLANWDVTPDGKTFVFVQLDRKNTTGTEIQITLNWGSHLELPTP